MKYMLLIYQDEHAGAVVDRDDCYREAARLIDELRSAGQYRTSAPLESTDTAISVRVRNGQRLLTKGPFAETHEQLGGYYLIESDNLDQAIRIAARIPAAQTGTVEIRPTLELPKLAGDK